MEKIFRSELEVRGYEMDSFGHVNNANYLNYLEFARWKMLNDEGVTLKNFQAWDRFPVIASIEIHYLKPTVMGDILTVETKLIDYRRSSMQLEQTILKGSTKVVTAKIRSVIVSGDGKPAELPEELEKRWRALLGKEEGAKNE